MKYFLGIDGGGTFTKCLLADQNGNVLAASKGAPCVHLADERSIRHIRNVFFQIIHESLSKAGLLDSTMLSGVALGITGVPHSKTPAAALYRGAIEEQFYVEKIEVGHDARIALAGAIPGLTGVIAIAGTGSMAFGMNGNGQEARAGGWGYLLGDPGSAYEIGRQALAAAGRQADGLGPATELTPALLDYFNVRTPEEIRPLIYTDPMPRVKIASLCRLVEETAKGGDTLAQLLLAEAGTALARLACAVIGKLELDRTSPGVSATGGVFECRPWIWNAFCEEVVRQCPQARLEPPCLQPLGGAVLLACRAAEIAVTPAMIDTLEKGLARLMR